MNNSYNKVFVVPKSVTPNNILSFLRMAEDIFDMRRQMKKKVLFDLSFDYRTNILGLLLMYKFIEYTTTNECFAITAVEI